jgi:hypothetical protein
MTVPRKDLGGQSRVDYIRHITKCWDASSPLFQNYYNIKAHFYAMNNWGVAAWLLSIVVTILLVTVVFEVQIFAAISIVVLTGVLSAMLIWLIERPRE